MRTKTLAVVLLLVVGVVAAPASAGGFFTDDDDSVHMRAIEAIADEGITKGCNPAEGNTRFCPKDVVTREQMATFLVRALGLPAAASSFVDLGTSVHAADIGALAAAGITRGCNPAEGNTRFCPKDPVTREQMATFLVRALELDPAASSFVDLGTSVHAADIGALAAAGITKGCNPAEGNTRFCPKDPVTREQMASFLTRALTLDASPRVVVTPNQDLFDIELGTSETETVAAITALLGPPTEDGPYACPYIVADNMRLVRWGSLEVTIFTVDTGSGLGFAGWRYGTLGGVFESGGPLPEHVELPFDLELLDPIGDAEAVSGEPIENTNLTWRIVDLGYARIEADGFAINPSAPITGVDVGVGFECE